MLSLRNSLWCAIAVFPALSAEPIAMLPEYMRSDPFGAIVVADASGVRRPLIAAREAYTSFQIQIAAPVGVEYAMHIDLPLPVDVYREWFHLFKASGRYVPDALIPVQLPYRSRLPEPDNRIPGQTSQAFWVDVWVPKDTSPGPKRGSVQLIYNGRTQTLPIELTVVTPIVPATDAITIDHNSYGTSWLGEQYPQLQQRLGSRFFASDEFFGLIHAYHRLFYEHRGTYHQLGYGHGGKVGPEFAPVLEGSGRSKKINSWELFDRHYGPLLDGSAFAKTRRGAKPIPYVYLPINPEWPASYLWWGELGYEAEFTGVVSAMEKHFREKGWTQTQFEMFFNHKKRYKGFEWDGDEARFPKDLHYLRIFRQLLDEAVPAGSPVHFRFRADASWMMEQQFRELAGVIDFWIVGGDLFSWYDYAPALLKARGDTVWFYSGAPDTLKPASAIAAHPAKAWMWGIDGYVHWLAVAPGADPWFDFGGGELSMAYPGERFGIAGPIPSLRLKLQRNCQQDLALLAAQPDRGKLLRGGVAERFNGTTPQQWWNPRPPLADTPPSDWSNASLDGATPADPRFGLALAPQAWQLVREYILANAKEAR